jgi:rhodanese-related sulfurtransferase
MWKNIKMRYKILAGFALVLILGFVLTKNLVAQVHVSNKSYDVMLSSMLAHSVPEIDVDSLENNPTVTMLDARAYREYEVSHIASAEWVGYDDFDISRVSHLDKSQPVVVYCSVGYRSEKVTEQLMNAGFTNVSNLYGGIFEWVNHGNPLVDVSGQPTEKIHAYSKSWGVWLSKGKKVYQ